MTRRSLPRTCHENHHRTEHLRPQDHDAEDLAGQVAQADELFSKGIYVHAVTVIAS